MIGCVVDGRWRVERELGRGGMGTVWLARDPAEPDRPVAVKFMTQLPGDSSPLMVRFKREFRATARLSHPNVVTLHAIGTTPEGCPWMVMEYLQGTTLSERLRAKGALPAAQVDRLVRHLAAALAHLHAREVIHRDLKPQNVMLVDEPGGSWRAVLLDFGLAALPDATRITATGVLLGTPAYIPPEGFEVGRPNQAWDLYQLGLVAFEALNGPPTEPLLGWTDLLRRAKAGPPRLRPGTPEADRWQPICDRLMASRPYDRPASAAEVLRLLDRPPQSTVAAPPQRLPRTNRALALLPLLAGVGLLWLGYGARPDPESGLEWLAAPGVDRVTVTWTSLEPYPSRVQLLEPSQLEVTGNGGAAVTSHAVTVEGLAPDTRYVLRILRPKGEASLPRAVRTRPATAGDDAAASLRRKAAWLARRLAAFHPEQVAEGLVQLGQMGAGSLMGHVLAEAGERTPEQAKQDRLLEEATNDARVQALARERLLATGLLEDYRAAAALAPLALGTSLLPFEERAVFHERLQRFLSLAAFLQFQRTSLPELERPALGHFEVSRTLLADVDVEVPIWRAPGAPLVFGLDLTNQPVPVVGRLEAQFEVPAAALPAPAAEVVLDALPFKKTALRLSVNGRLDLLVVDQPILSATDDPRPLRQRIPPEVLRPGRNTLELRYDSLFGRVCEWRVELRSVALRLARR